MKKLILAIAIAMMGLGSNAMARELPNPILNFGVHVGIGTAQYWDCPPAFLVGKDDWGGLAVDLGGVMKFNINEVINFLTELNIGLNTVSRDIVRSHTRYGYYTQQETRTILKTDVPFLLRVKPKDFIFVDVGAQLNFNFWYTNTKEYKDEYGQSIRVNGDVEKWDVKTHVTSLVFGFGIGGRIGDMGVRFILDLDRINKNDRIVYYDDGEEITLIEDAKNINGRDRVLTSMDNKTKMWSVQFVVNYYFGNGYI